MKINKPLYYILNCTWGCIMTLIGAVVALALLCVGKKPQKHAGCTYFNVGKSWGGMELGCFFLTDSNDSTPTKNHEFGHSLQNCLWGPLFPFVVCIPSAIRYWLREFKTQKSKKIYAVILTVCLILVGICITLSPFVVFDILGYLVMMYAIVICLWLFGKEIPQYASDKYIPYDKIWFEGQATEWGTKVSKDW